MDCRVKPGNDEKSGLHRPHNSGALRMIRRLAAALILSLLAAPAGAGDVVRINTLPTARSLPFYVAVEKGMFARHGLRAELEFTENSRNLRDGLASGKYDIVHSAVDNAVDMIEAGKKDVV